RTWVYPAQYSDEENGEYRDVFFKFQWAIDSDLEIGVHQFILDKGVPHVPRLLYAASMVGKGASGPYRQRFKGEVMVMEDVGMSIASAFDANGLNKSDAEIIDLFAGYAHALFAAATVEDDKFALHRDVSMGNLMVGPSGKPYIIDWGCGRVCTVGEKMRSSSKEMIGTAIYMGIRILANSKSRSVVDDLESLFLVLCHCIWRRYGTRNGNYESLWSQRNLAHVKDSRMCWLASTNNLFRRMEFSSSRPSEALCCLVKGMHGLLFPSTSPIASFDFPCDDPRVDSFDKQAWLRVFDAAASMAVDSLQTPMPCLGALQAHVKNDSGRRISFIAELPIQPLEKQVGSSQSDSYNMLLDADNMEHRPETPTADISRKRFSGSDSHIAKKPRQ
ncbi:hypothetical protein LPJ75_005187, partial [Coemansia sp. RSA 2598]